MQRGLRKHKPINKVWNNCLIHTFVCQKRFSSHRIHRLAQRPSPSIICIGSYCTLCAVRCTACECEWEYTVSRMNFMFIFCVSYYLYYSFIYRTVRPTDRPTKRPVSSQSQCIGIIKHIIFTIIEQISLPAPQHIECNTCTGAMNGHCCVVM